MPTQRRGARALLDAARPKQWLKNALVLTGAGAAGGTGALTQATVLTTASAFVAASVAVYLLNDVFDAEEDRRDPEKAGRPIASGALRPGYALNVALLLAIAACGATWSTGSFLMIAIYLAMNLCYTLGFKRVPWLETLPVTAGFPLRVLAGAAATPQGAGAAAAVALVVVPVALGIVVAKREGEMREGHGARAVAVHYRMSTLRNTRRWAFSVAVLVNPALLTLADRGAAGWMTLSSAGLSLALWRFESSAEARGAPRPEQTARRDLFLLAGAALWACGVVLA